MSKQYWMMAVLVAGLLGAGRVLAGSLDSTNAPGPTMHTLEEIYQAQAVTTGILVPYVVSNLWEIRNEHEYITNMLGVRLSPQTLSDTTPVVNVGYYAATNLTQVDADLASGNIKTSVAIFGIVGTLSTNTSAYPSQVPRTGVYITNTISPQDASAADKKVLFVSISGGYNGDGVNMYNELNTYATAYHNNTPGLVEYVLLDVNGEVAALLSQNTYEQIWVYDLSTGADDYPTDYAAIDAWYDAAPLKEVICDGRFLSSFWRGRNTTEGRLLTANYYKNLVLRGGGIVLATDHNAFANAGMNILANTLGFGNFTGNFGGSFPLDAGHPLTSNPNVLTALSNDSSTGQAPFGLQPGGRTLRTIGYHSGNTLNPGISTTINGGVLGITVTIVQAGGIICSGIRCPCGKAGSYTIPNGVTGIGNEAFFGCASLTSVTIPNGVTHIGKMAFLGCWSLTFGTIPASVTSIGDAAFCGCRQEPDQIIPAGGTNIVERLRERAALCAVIRQK